MVASLDQSQEGGGEFVIARSDAPPLLKFGEKAFDAPSPPCQGQYRETRARLGAVGDDLTGG